MTLLLSRNAPDARRRAPALGERNSNPGNIRFLERNAWNGQEPSPGDGGFGRYATPELGIRALILQIRRHLESGAPSIEALIRRWAPPSENDTGAYIAAVATDLGVAPTAEIDPEDAYSMLELAQAIARHECGYLPWDEATWRRGAVMAGYHPGRRDRLTDSGTIRLGSVGSIAGTIGSAITADQAKSAIAAAAEAGSAIPWTTVVPTVLCMVCAAACLWIMLRRRQDWEDGLR